MIAPACFADFVKQILEFTENRSIRHLIPPDGGDKLAIPFLEIRGRPASFTRLIEINCFNLYEIR